MLWWKKCSWYTFFDTLSIIKFHCRLYAEIFQQHSALPLLPWNSACSLELHLKFWGRRRIPATGSQKNYVLVPEMFFFVIRFPKCFSRDLVHKMFFSWSGSQNVFKLNSFTSSRVVIYSPLPTLHRNVLLEL